MGLGHENQIRYQQLEGILSHLPEPHSIQVWLIGNYDYDRIRQQAGETVPGLELGIPYSAPLFNVENPSKENLLAIYQQQVPLSERGSPRFMSGIDTRTYVDLNEAAFLQEGAAVIITPVGAQIAYAGREPQFVTALLGYLSSEGIFSKVEKSRSDR